MRETLGTLTQQFTPCFSVLICLGSTPLLLKRLNFLSLLSPRRFGLLPRPIILAWLVQGVLSSSWVSKQYLLSQSLLIAGNLGAYRVYVFT